MLQVMRQEMPVVFQVNVLFGFIKLCACVIPAPALEPGLQRDYLIAPFFKEGYVYKISSVLPPYCSWNHIIHQAVEKNLEETWPPQMTWPR